MSTLSDHAETGGGRPDETNLKKQIADLKDKLAECSRQLKSSRAERVAMSEVLHIISSFPTDTGPIFQAIIANALTVCGAVSGGVLRLDGTQIHLVAHTGWTPEERDSIRSSFPLALDRRSVTGRAILTQQVAHVHDIAADPEYASIGMLQSGLRTILSVPMLQDGNPIGAITVDRRDVRPFSENEIALLKTFADQAAIVIENVRLFNELRQRQSELRVTLDSMGDGVVMFDQELRLAAWNQNFQRTVELPEAVLESRPSFVEYVNFLAARGEFGPGETEEEVRQRLYERIDQQWSTERRRPNGKIIEVRHNPVPHGGFVLIYQDITERRRAEEEVRAARDVLVRQAQQDKRHLEWLRSLGAFLRHEVRQPVAQINSSIELVQLLSEHDNRIAGYLSNALLGAQHVWNLIERASRATDAEAFVRQNRTQLTDMSRLVVTLVDGFKQTYSGLDFVLHGVETQIFALADPTLINEALGNLLSNAASYALEDSTIEVTVSKIGKDAVIDIDNKGPLVPEDTESLFNPFSSTRAEPGSVHQGLGLYLVRLIAECHAGDASIANLTDSTGVRASMRLPVSVYSSLTQR